MCDAAPQRRFGRRRPMRAAEPSDRFNRRRRRAGVTSKCCPSKLMSRAPSADLSNPGEQEIDLVKNGSAAEQIGIAPVKVSTGAAPAPNPKALVSPASALPARGFVCRPLRKLGNRVRRISRRRIRSPGRQTGGRPKSSTTLYCENHKVMLYISTCRTERPAWGLRPETFRAEPRTKENFFIPIACNPLKSLDSEK